LGQSGNGLNGPGLGDEIMKRLLIAVKRTKWERDLLRFGSEKDVLRLYEIQNHAYQRVHSSHERQMKNLEALRRALPEASYAYREDLPGLNRENFDYIASFGGDNHFVYVSHFTSGHPILGINSDPETSHGALLYFTIESLLEKLSQKNAEFVTEPWTRVDCDLEFADGRRFRTGPCTSEISLRSAFPESVSRYHIRKSGQPWEEHKSSGLLLASGAGSTGWFRNCHPASLRRGTTFEKDAPFFRIVAREYGQGSRRLLYRHASINAGEALEVISEMDGEINIDCHPERTYEFPPACRALFFMSPEPLRVVRDICPKK